ncbi:hypothetical protein [Klebsiella pneumoniae]|uniref:hypothetical protein n=1 Tax=Klebsiella pneumoniae TaxID=573 RepID=UPI0009B50FCB|nr:hypothetical protein [Klebsiella pneumoniae]ROF70346.1 hypothetical protein C4Y69_027520 [Klebsiella pneumoniae subsp. pneumoniae]ROH16111.1 hypothetical protein BL144_00021020 [Klebsiella pneumoniae]
MTNNQLAPERISDISDYFVEMQDHYSDPADRENFEIFRDAELLMKELQERRKAERDSEPVVYASEETLAYAAHGELLLRVLSQPAGDAIIPLYRHAQPVPGVDADDNFYSWFGREWAENYQHNQYTTAAKQMLGVMAESAWKAATERHRQKQSVSVPDVKMYEDVPYEVGRLKTHRDCYCDGWNACRAAMLNGGKS